MEKNDELRVFKDDPITYKELNEKLIESQSTNVQPSEEKANKSIFKAYLW
jgi:hypothetical protein